MGCPILCPQCEASPPILNTRQTKTPSGYLEGKGVRDEKKIAATGVHNYCKMINTFTRTQVRQKIGAKISTAIVAKTALLLSDILEEGWTPP